MRETSSQKAGSGQGVIPRDLQLHMKLHIECSDKKYGVFSNIDIGYKGNMSKFLKEKKTVWRNQREAVRKIIHSFRFVRPAGGHNVSSTTGTQYRAATQLFWAIVMSDECDVLCCREVCTSIAAVAQWVEQSPATQVTGDQIPERVHIDVFFVLFISPLYISWS